MASRGNPKNGGVKLLIAAAITAFVLLSGWALPGKDRPPVKPAEPSKFEVWHNDIKAFEERWNVLVRQRSKVETAKWQSLEDELRSVTKKYAERTEDHFRRTSGAAVDSGDGGFSRCPTRDDVPGYKCYLFPGPKGVCRYVCIPVKKP